jgi:hypothetical protein
MYKIMALFAFVLVTFVSGIVSAAETKVVAMSDYDEAQIEWYQYYGTYSQSATTENVHSTATKKAAEQKKGSK